MKQNKKKYELLPDEKLMILASKGHENAFVTIVSRHQQHVMNFFYRMGVYTDSDDLTQNTFIKLFKYRKNYRNRAKFTTFLYFVARRVLIDHLRKEERREKLKECVVTPNELENKPFGERNDLAVQALEMLHTLSEDMKSVVVLNIYQGLRYHEIAEVLEIPVGTVKTRMFYALRSIRNKMSNDNNKL